MMKLFRKYNKQLLAVFAAALLIAWLGGSALTALLDPDPGSRVVATACGHEIRQRDRSNEQASTEILNRMGLIWQMPWAQIPQMPVAETVPALTVLDWMLLKLEASELGIEVRQTEVEGFLEQIRMTPTALARLQSSTNLPRDMIYSFVADFLRVRRMVSMMAGTIKISEPEILNEAKLEQESVKVALASISADELKDDSYQPADAELQAQFDKYREQTPGSGDVYGYVIPDKVRVQYIKIDPEKVVDHITVSERQQRRYFKEHQQEFLRPADPTDAEATTQPDPDPAQVKSPYYETFAEARHDVEKKLKENRAKEAASRLVDNLRRRLAEPWYDAVEGEDGYKIAPEATKTEDYYKQVVAAATKDLPFADAVTVRTTDLCQFSDIPKIESIGGAFMTAGADSTKTFDQLAFLAQGLVEIPPRESGVDQTLYLAVWQTGPTYLDDTLGAQYLYRPVEAAASHTPENLEAVRDKVVEDVRTIRGLEAAKKGLEGLLETARAKGLKVAWEADTALQERLGEGTFFHEPSPFKRVVRLTFQDQTFELPGSVPGVGSDVPKFIEECFEAGELPGEHRVKLIEVPEYNKWVLIEHLETTPMTKEQYASIRARTAQQLLGNAISNVIADWMQSDNIKGRVGFKTVSAQE